MIEIGDQPRLFRPPSQPFRSELARGRHVGAEEVAEKAEMFGRLGGRFRDDRQGEAFADDLGDLTRRHAFVGDPVIPRARGPLFEREPVEVRRIEPVHAWPAVAPIADIGRHAFFGERWR